MNNSLLTKPIRRAIIAIIAIIAILLLFITSRSCNKCDNTAQEEKVQKPWNVTILIDLSDRIIKADGQIDRDTAIVEAITAELFREKVTLKKLRKATDKLQIVFYPELSDNLSKSLSFDFENFEKLKVQAKRALYDSIKNEKIISSRLNKLYNKAKEQSNFTGCDIWGFFDKGKAKKYCVRKGFRNVLVILTDGYIFDVNNKQKITKDNHAEYSYILPQTLKDKDARLIPCEPVGDLEIMMLELCPNPKTDYDQMETVIEDWLKAMNISKYMIADTDAPESTKKVIRDFLKEEENCEE